MAKTSRDRVKQLLERRKKGAAGRCHTGLGLYTARKLDRIKEITGPTNDKIIEDAIEQFYKKYFSIPLPSSTSRSRKNKSKRHKI